MLKACAILEFFILNRIYIWFNEIRMRKKKAILKANQQKNHLLIKVMKKGLLDPIDTY